MKCIIPAIRVKMSHFLSTVDAGYIQEIYDTNDLLGFYICSMCSDIQLNVLCQAF